MKSVFKTLFVCVVSFAFIFSLVGCDEKRQLTEEPTYAGDQPSQTVEPDDPEDIPAAPNAGVPSNPNDPYPGLVIDAIPPENPQKELPLLVLDLAKYEKYMRQNLRGYIESPSSYSGGFNGVQGAEIRYEGQFMVNEKISNPLINNGSAIVCYTKVAYIMCYEEYGLVSIYFPSSEVYFADGDGRSLGCLSEKQVYYSLSLGYVIPQDLARAGTTIHDLDRMRELWPDDCKKYLDSLR